MIWQLNICGKFDAIQLQAIRKQLLDVIVGLTLLLITFIMAGKKSCLIRLLCVCGHLMFVHVCTCLYMFVHLIVVVLACHVCTSLSLA